MKYSAAFITVMMLAGCAPIVEQVEQQEETPVPFEQEEQEEHAEEVLSGEAEATIEVEAPEAEIVERLLPSGLLEIGDRDAKLILLMFTEHHCRYCKEFHVDHFPKLLRDYIDQGKLRLQIAMLPLQKYAGSEQAAATLYCAAAQGKGVAMHELLFELGAPDRETMMREANTLELDIPLFTECIDSEETIDIVENQKSLARSLDVTLVPTFFLNGERSVGLPYYADLRGMIETMQK